MAKTGRRYYTYLDSLVVEGYESIKDFAGDEIEKAKYYNEDKKYLLEFEPNVMHCDTFNFKSPIE